MRVVAARHLDNAHRERPEDGEKREDDRDHEEGVHEQNMASIPLRHSGGSGRGPLPPSPACRGEPGRGKRRCVTSKRLSEPLFPPPCPPPQAGEGNSTV